MSPAVNVSRYPALSGILQPDQARLELGGTDADKNVQRMRSGIHADRRHADTNRVEPILATASAPAGPVRERVAVNYRGTVSLQVDASSDNLFASRAPNGPDLTVRNGRIRQEYDLIAIEAHCRGPLGGLIRDATLRGRNGSPASDKDHGSYHGGDLQALHFCLSCVAMVLDPEPATLFHEYSIYASRGLSRIDAPCSNGRISSPHRPRPPLFGTRMPEPTSAGGRLEACIAANAEPVTARRTEGADRPAASARSSRAKPARPDAAHCRGDRLKRYPQGCSYV